MPANITSTTLYYDPQRQGYDTALWKTLTGTPAASGNNLRFNTAAGIHYGDLMHADVVEFKLNVPVVPTSGDDRQFGLSFLNYGAYAYFDITDDVCSVKISDGLGHTDSAEITFETGWAAADVRFAISWSGGKIAFKVQDVVVKEFTGDAIPKVPMSVYIRNANADNLDMVYLLIKNTQMHI